MAQTQKTYLGDTQFTRSYMGDNLYQMASSAGETPLGKFLYGGYVFYIDGTDWYIAYNLNLSGDFADVLGINCGTTNGLGTGPNNTQLLSNNGSAVATAALNATYNGKTDWFIPSYDLLGIMCNNKVYIPNFASGNYRSSTEGIGGSASFYIGSTDISTCNLSASTYKSLAFGSYSTRVVRKEIVT
jgi:hypothetical protein